METTVRILIGIVFLCQISAFISMGNFKKNGVRYKRLGNEKTFKTNGNKKEALIQYMFAVISFLLGALTIYFISGWFLQLLIGLYVAITLNQCDHRRNYLTFKHGLRQYIWRGPLWLLCIDNYGH